MRKTKRVMAAAGVAVLLFGLSGCAQMNREQHKNCTVEEKDRTTNTEGGSSHRIYTDCGVFEVADNLLEGRFNAADSYSKIEVGGVYNFETIGWRNGFLSLFPNIVKSELVG